MKNENIDRNNELRSNLVMEKIYFHIIKLIFFKYFDINKMECF